MDPDMPTDMDYFYRAAKYVEKAFKLFDRKTKVKTKIKSSFGQLSIVLDNLGLEIEKSEQNENKDTG